MIYTVGQNSPPRYLIQGAEEEDNEEINYKGMRDLKTQVLAQSVLTNPALYTFELEIRFVNLYNRNEVRVQTVKASAIQVHDDRITCIFQQTAGHPLFFAWNHQARYSACSLFVTGPETNNQKKRIGYFRQYLESPLNPSFNITSLDTHLRANLIAPEPEALQQIKPQAARKLFSDDISAPPLVDLFKKEKVLKMGAITQVEKVQVDILVK